MASPTTTGPRFGVALGGGGSRAFAHWGALQALEQAGHRPAFVSGSSMGALIGAVYAAEADADAALARMRGYFDRHPSFGAQRRPPRANGVEPRRGWWGRRAKSLVEWGLATTICWRRALRGNRPFETAVDALVGDRRFEDLRLPFACVAVDLTRGRLAVFDKGPLAPALKAGAAVGMVMPPVAFDGAEYADAAVAAAVPVAACRALGAERVLALDVGTPFPENAPLDTGFDVVWRLLQVTSRLLNDKELAAADWVLRPDSADIFWGDFTRAHEAIPRGAEAARRLLATLATAEAAEGGA